MLKNAKYFTSAHIPSWLLGSGTCKIFCFFEQFLTKIEHNLHKSAFSRYFDSSNRSGVQIWVYTSTFRRPRRVLFFWGGDFSKYAYSSMRTHTSQVVRKAYFFRCARAADACFRRTLLATSFSLSIFIIFFFRCQFWQQV